MVSAVDRSVPRLPLVGVLQYLHGTLLALKKHSIGHADDIVRHRIPYSAVVIRCAGSARRQI